MFSADCFSGFRCPRICGDPCLEWHSEISPGQVADWEVSAHAENGIGCQICHGDAHSSAEDYQKARLPDEKLCSGCHKEQFDQFARGKHNFGWTSLNAIPATHFAPDELIEGGRGCCHNMGIPRNSWRWAIPFCRKSTA